VYGIVRKLKTSLRHVNQQIDPVTFRS